MNELQGYILGFVDQVLTNFVIQGATLKAITAKGSTKRLLMLIQSPLLVKIT